MKALLVFAVLATSALVQAEVVNGENMAPYKAMVSKLSKELAGKGKSGVAAYNCVNELLPWADKLEINDQGNQPLLVFTAPGGGGSVLNLIITTDSQYENITGVRQIQLSYENVVSGNLRYPKLTKQWVVKNDTTCL